VGEKGLLAGRVGRPHGLDGSFYVNRPRVSLLELGMVVRLGEQEMTIVRRAGTTARPIVRLDGCEHRGGAEVLRDTDMVADAAAAAPLPEGEWWAEQLAGCVVVDGGRRVGVVRRMLGLPSCECLEVERPDGSELLVPMVRDAIRRVDVGAGEIDVNLAFLGDAS